MKFSTKVPRRRLTCGLIALGLCIAATALAVWGSRYFLHTAPTGSFPIQIAKITVSPEPKVGQPAKLRVEFSSYRDEADVTLTIRLAEGIKQMGGSLEWHGSLVANQPLAHEVPICVLYEGYWQIAVAISSQLAPDSSYGDLEYFYIKSTGFSAEFFDRHPTQPPGGYKEPTPLPPPPTNVCQ